MFETPPKHITIDSLEQLCDLGRSISSSPTIQQKTIKPMIQPSNVNRAVQSESEHVIIKEVDTDIILENIKWL